MSEENYENQDKVELLSQYEANIKQLISQKQAFQSQLFETDSALNEAKSAKEVYKIIGNIMVLSDKSSVEDDLLDKKKMLEIRVSGIDKQEQLLKSKADSLQNEILNNIKNKKQI